MDYPLTEVVFARFFCCLVLHMQLANELQRGLNFMKFTTNHQYRFVNYKTAWFAGFMQASVSYIIEVANLLVILSSSTVLDVVMNFMALEIVSQFDNFFYAASVSRVIQEAVKDGGAVRDHFKPLYTITKTTSKHCSYKAMLPEKVRAVERGFKHNAKQGVGFNPEVTEEFLQYNFGPKRSFGAFLLHKLYRSFRLVQVSVWYYFFPFLAIYGSYWTPYYIATSTSAGLTELSLIPEVFQTPAFMTAQHP